MEELYDFLNINNNPEIPITITRTPHNTYDWEGNRKVNILREFKEIKPMAVKIIIIKF